LNLVIDGSVAVKWCFEESGSDGARQLLLRERAGGVDLIAPDLIVAEVVNAVWKKVRREQCSARSAFEALALWTAGRPELMPTVLLEAPALELAIRLGHPAYDCFYLAAASVLSAPLVTADSRLAALARGVLREVELIG
jgi:predicted nucleic acid-binding protein